jgi:hypothetical protein
MSIQAIKAARLVGGARDPRRCREQLVVGGGAAPARRLEPVAHLDALDRAKKDGDTLGGIVEVLAYGVPPGLGSHVQWDRRLDGRLAQARPPRRP